jgi:hypothetical protein
MRHRRAAGICAGRGYRLRVTIAPFLAGEKHDTHFAEVLVAAGVIGYT